MPESTENITPRSLIQEKKESLREDQMFSRAYRRVSFLKRKEVILAISSPPEVSEIKYII